MYRFLLASCALIFSSDLYGQDSVNSDLIDRISSGSINVTVDTLVFDQPALYFAKGFVEASAKECSFDDNVPLAVKALRINQIFFFPFSYLPQYDENGKPDPTRDLGVLAGRSARWVAKNKLNEEAFEPVGAEYFKVLVETAGCSGEALRKFHQNAFAVMALGRLPHVSSDSFENMLAREEYEPGNVTIWCHYHPQNGERYYGRQIHYATTPANVASLSLGAISPIVLQLGYFPFIRGNCPASPDPLFELTRGELIEKEFSGSGGSLAERMAYYYIEILALHEAGYRFSDDGEKEAIMEEIVKYESPELTMAEVTAESARYRDRFSPEESCFFADNEVRRVRFHEAHGRAVRLDHLPHKLQEPDFETIVVPGGAYLASPYNGRADILKEFGLVWRWKQHGCTQTD
jgi:hypothetical protein